MKMYKGILLIIGVLLLVGCSNGSTDSSTISISFGQATLPGKATVSINQLKHVITLSGPTGTQTHTISGTGTMNATVVAGHWEIDVEGYFGDELYSVGSATTEVKAGRTSNVAIQMTIVWYNFDGSSSSPGGNTTVSITIGFAGGTDPAKGFDDMLPSTLDLSYEFYLINDKTPSQKEPITVDPATGKATEQVSPGSYSIEAIAKVNGWDYAENDPVSFSVAARETKDVPVTMHRLPDSIVLSINKETLVFDTVPLTYGPQTPKTVDVWSFGSTTPSLLTVTVATSNFTVLGSPLTSINQDGPGVPFTVGPITGLAVGTYTETVEIRDGSTVMASFDVSFRVSNKSTGAVANTPKLDATPTTDTITITSAGTLSTGQSVELGINTTNSAPGTWQPGLSFTGLTPGSTYYVFARSAENATHDAGTPSAALKVVTAGLGMAAWTALPTTGSISAGNYRVNSGGGTVTATDLVINGTVNIYIPSGVTLSATGTSSSGQNGGKAGVNLSSGQTLFLHGGGTLTAQGGNAGQGANGGDGDAATINASTYATGAGGAGGYGGGGAGAGIGTDGGAGGAGGAGGTARTGAVNLFAMSTSPGAAGGNGSNGTSSSAAGTLHVLDTVNVSAAKGSASTTYGSGGTAPTAPIPSVTGGAVGSEAIATAGHGGGGGSGYNGLQNSFSGGIGSGGGGGRGAGGGGSGGMSTGPIASPQEGNGVGGIGYDSGDTATYTYTYYSAIVGFQGIQGSNDGSDGGTPAQGTVYALTPGNVSGSNTAIQTPTPAFTINYDANGGSLGLVPATQGIYTGAPAFVSGGMPSRAGFVFARWNDAPDGSGTDYSANMALPNASLTLYAVWE